MEFQVGDEVAILSSGATRVRLSTVERTTKVSVRLVDGTCWSHDGYPRPRPRHGACREIIEPATQEHRDRAERDVLLRSLWNIGRELDALSLDQLRRVAKIIRGEE